MVLPLYPSLVWTSDGTLFYFIILFFFEGGGHQSFKELSKHIPSSLPVNIEVSWYNQGLLFFSQVHWNLSIQYTFVSILLAFLDLQQKRIFTL